MKKLLIDTMPFTVKLEESESGGKLVARGEHARIDVPTDNNRLYPRSVWEVNRNRLSEAMSRRRVFGELDHPGDGKTKLQRVSHLTTKFDIDDASGIVIAEDEILDTPNGRILMALSKAGCELAVSSRGFGSVKENADGVEVVQDDYRLLAWDFVADPAMRTAYPEIFSEERNIPEDEMDLKTLKKEYPGLYSEIAESTKADADKASAKVLAEANETAAKTIQEAVDAAKKDVTEEMKDKFTSELMRETEKIREIAEDKVRGELMSDPSVAGAKAAIEAVSEALAPFFIPAGAEDAIKARDDEIVSLKKSLAEKELESGQTKQENKELAHVAKKAAYTLHLERLLKGDDDEMTSAVVELVGKVEDLDSVEEIDTKVEAIRAQLEHRSEDDDSEERAEEMKEKNGKIKELVKENEELKGKVVEVAKLAEQMQVQVYAASQMAGHPQAMSRTVKRQLAKASSSEEVDEIIEGLDGGINEEDEMARIRAKTQRGKARDLEEDTNGAPDSGEGQPAYDPLKAELGVSMEEITSLSGFEEFTEEGHPRN